MRSKATGGKAGPSPKGARAGASSLSTVDEEEFGVPSGGAVSGVLRKVVSGLLEEAKVGARDVADADHASMLLQKCLEAQQADSLKKVNTMVQAQGSALMQPG